MVVVAHIAREDRTEIVVAPITHTPPDRPDAALEVPLQVKRVLGLNDERSWIVTSELNRFLWPGPDLRIAPGRDTPLYDAIPRRLFQKVREAIGKQVATGRLKVTKRTE